MPDDGCSLVNYYERRGRLDALAGIAVYRRGTAVVGDPGATEREHVSWVSPDFFATLGLGPMIGRRSPRRRPRMRQAGWRSSRMPTGSSA